jgi:ferredoxin/flavodoxin---NADP+ reductase
MSASGPPLRVAIVGSGPAGFYTAELLFKQTAVPVAVDMFERLPSPFGLLRTGVAPDHQKIKQAAKAFERTASNAGFRFLGNVEVGKHASVEELSELYDQVVFATGSARDRSLGIPGEQLRGVHASTAFVGWYNGHPEYCEERFDLSVERAAVVGIGNVAMDVVRVLVRKPEELAVTDIAGYAHAALAQSRVREVLLFGRRGPAQAAFSLSEITDIAELDGVQVLLDPEPVLAAQQEPDLDSTQRRLLDYLARLAAEPDRNAPRRVRVIFLSSPIEILGDDGRARALRVEKNVLVQKPDGQMGVRGTGQHELYEAGLIFSAIGFLGTAIPGVPFDERKGVVPNDSGRVLDAAGAPIAGLYAVGWIKRGPQGLIGSNKGCAAGTVASMLADAKSNPARKQPARTIEALLASRGVRPVSFPQWRMLDELERASGQRLGKVREKFTTVAAMLAALESAEKSG